eukprot:9253645-Pyramimonas_sp.AAC.1
MFSELIVSACRDLSIQTSSSYSVPTTRSPFSTWSFKSDVRLVGFRSGKHLAVATKQVVYILDEEVSTRPSSTYPFASFYPTSLPSVLHSASFCSPMVRIQQPRCESSNPGVNPATQAEVVHTHSALNTNLKRLLRHIAGIAVVEASDESEDLLVVWSDSFLQRAPLLASEDAGSSSMVAALPPLHLHHTQ